jgi:fanconi-associated nuclease 1
LCRVLCEDYAQRGSGVPDLFIWNYEEKHCKFVEVKGPGDRLQENQKVRISLGCQAECTILKSMSIQLWVDVMQRAEVKVEVCHVEEQGKSTTTKRQTKGKKRSSKTRAKRKKPKPVDSDTESVISGWEDEDELSASQYLQGDDQGSTLVRKRAAEDTVRGAELGNKPTTKRPRTSIHEAD